jgi:hypothetical protein
VFNPKSAPISFFVSLSLEFFSRIISRGLLVALLLFALVEFFAFSSVLAQFSTPLHIFLGKEKGGRFGVSLSVQDVGKKVNFPKLLVGAPGEGSGIGKVHLFDLGSGALLRTWSGRQAAGEYGFSLCDMGDLDGDGVSDFVVGAPKDGKGKVFVYSRKKGNLLYSLEGKNKDSQFGFSLSKMPDIDGDGIADLLVGAPYDSAQRGYVSLISGKKGREIKTIVGPSKDLEFGWAVAFVGDVNGDKLPDFAVGAPRAMNKIYYHLNNGALFVYSTKTYKQIKYYRHDDWFWRLGTHLSKVGDLDRDGTDEVFFGCWNDQYITGPRYNGASQVFGRKWIPSSRGALPGDAVSFLGQDWDGDGIFDLLLGYARGDAARRPAVRVLSSKTGRALFERLSPTWAKGFGSKVIPVGDLDQDGVFEIAVSAPDGSPDARSVGAVFIYRGERVRWGKSPVIRIPTSSLKTGVLEFQDMDRDGVRDFLEGGMRGSIQMTSGKTGKAIWIQKPSTGNSHEVKSLAELEDLNGDRIHDFAVGRTLRNLIEIRSGRDGSLLRSIPGLVGSQQSGYCLARIGDLNGDKKKDLFVGAFSGPSFVVSPKDGKRLRTIQLSASYAMSNGDFTKDGVVDLWVGSVRSGNTHLVDLKKGRVIYSLPFYGRILDPGDLDGDGVFDLLVGDTKGVYAFSFSRKKVLYRVADWNSYVFIDNGPNMFLEVCPDLDGDGAHDFALGSEGPSFSTNGTLFFYSGRTGQRIAQFETGPVSVFGGLVPRNRDPSGGFLLWINLPKNRISLRLPPLPKLETSTYLQSSLGMSPQVLWINAGPSEAGGLYLILSGLSGPFPGISLGTKKLPLNLDSFSSLALGMINQGPFAQFLGVLDARGRGKALLQGHPLLHHLAGLQLHHALIVFNGFSVRSLGGPVFTRILK